MAKGDVHYDTWHGITVAECGWCGYPYDVDYFKNVCPDCGARLPDATDVQ